jgi:hypothetical protein
VVLLGFFSVITYFLLLSVDQGASNCLESTAFLIAHVCDAIKNMSVKSLLYLADRIRTRQSKIELENRKIREAL